MHSWMNAPERCGVGGVTAAAASSKHAHGCRHTTRATASLQANQNAPPAENARQQRAQYLRALLPGEGLDRDERPALPSHRAHGSRSSRGGDAWLLKGQDAKRPAGRAQQLLHKQDFRGNRQHAGPPTELPTAGKQKWQTHQHHNASTSSWDAALPVTELLELVALRGSVIDLDEV